MRYVGSILVLCAAAALAGVPNAADAFELQGTRGPSSATSLAIPPQSFLGDSKGYSLTMPLTGAAESSEYVSSYGNSIPIPGPGIDAPAPAWAYSPRN